MSDVFVDTDVFSFVFKGDTRADAYRPHLEGHRLFLSFQSVAELHRWSLERKWGERTRDLLEQSMKKDYIVLPPDDQTCRRWAQLMADGRMSGRAIATSDAWIAATALRHNVPLVTHNRAHFENVADLTLICES